MVEKMGKEMCCSVYWFPLGILVHRTSCLGQLYQNHNFIQEKDLKLLKYPTSSHDTDVFLNNREKEECIMQDYCPFLVILLPRVCPRRVIAISLT